MSTVGVKELKNCLTQYLRRTKQGEEVIVTERGNPIALIQPIKSAEKAVSLEARLDLRRRVLWPCQAENL
jgi:prevent-host-death family protein